MKLATKQNSTHVSLYNSIFDIDQELINRWRELETRSIDSNAYMSPDFVIPAVKHLTPDIDLIIIAVDYTDDQGTQTIGLGVFESVKGIKQFPCAFLRAYRSPHSFLSGLLIDKSHIDLALSKLLHTIKNHPNKWHAIEFIRTPIATAIHDIAADVLKKHQIRRHEISTEERAILIPHEEKNNDIKHTISKGTQKNINRRKRRLEELGKVKWILKKSSHIKPITIETFLALEDKSWKHEKKTSLHSQEKHREFFNEQIQNFTKRNKAFFTEIELDGTTIASTCNLMSGNAGFAFKLGWDPEYAKYGIGILNEFELAKHAPQLLASLEYIDSGAVPGSFIEKLWPKKRILYSGFYSLNTMAAAYLSSTQKIRWIKNYIKQKF